MKIITRLKTDYIEELRFEDLLHYFVAPIALEYLLGSSMTLEQISRQFKTPSRPNGVGVAFIRNSITSVYKLDVDIIKIAGNLQKMSNLITKMDFESANAFSRRLGFTSFSKRSDTLRNYMRYYIQGKEPEMTLFDQYKVAILEPKVQSYFKLNTPLDTICSFLPHFDTVDELLA